MYLSHNSLLMYFSAKSISHQVAVMLWLMCIGVSGCGQGDKDVPDAADDREPSRQDMAAMQDMAADLDTSDAAGDDLSVAPAGRLDVEVTSRVGENGVTSLWVRLHNTSGGPLTIFEAPQLMGEGGVIVEQSQAFYPQVVIKDGAEPARDEIILEIRPLMLACEPRMLSLRVVTNDAEEAQAVEPGRFARMIDIPLVQQGVLLSADRLDFGGVKVPGPGSHRYVDVLNCSEDDVFIKNVSLEMSLDVFTLEAVPSGLIRSGDKKIVRVRYRPDTFEEHTVSVRVELENKTLSQNLYGRGHAGACPTARIDPETYRSVVLNEMLELDGSGSSSSGNAPLSQYIWTLVKAPGTFKGVLSPSDQSPEKTRFSAPQEGDYTVRLQVIDAQNVASCEEASLLISAYAPPSKGVLRIELTWSNPEDPDGTDDDGADLDLHFLKMGPGRWFEAPYDVYFRNIDPMWAEENPKLELDDMSSDGLELVTLDSAQECGWYAVGVHYYSQLYGASQATLSLVGQEGGLYRSQTTELLGSQFWDALRIHWDGERFRIFDIVTPRLMYDVAPEGIPAEVIDDMKTSGLCTAEMLY